LQRGSGRMPDHLLIGRSLSSSFLYRADRHSERWMPPPEEIEFRLQWYRAGFSYIKLDDLDAVSLQLEHVVFVVTLRRFGSLR
jgi:hypothetical protein